MEEKRRHQRKPVSIAATHETVGIGTACEGVIRDISMGGVFIESSDVPTFGAELSIRVRLPSQSSEVTLPGIVRWVKRDGFGVQFGLLGARETHAIVEFLRRPA